MKKYLWMPSAAVVIGALRVNILKSKFVWNYWYQESEFVVPNNLLKDNSSWDSRRWNKKKKK